MTAQTDGRTRRPGGLLAKAMLGAAALTALATVPAGAAEQQILSAPYNGACGSGYGVVNSAPVGEGTIYLTYNSSNGYNCAVTVRRNDGTKPWMSVKISQGEDPGWASVDEGYFGGYAGPVYVYGKGHCIDWFGAIGSATMIVNDTNC
ncbi:spore-associated protein A [Kitasatospora sp. NBC_00374]|uniref:spore-associated protein A n=1 Tax=Kitasatospora sp. NBC_00374 TaxID=2975964 RepID=UPI0030E0ED33